jgi:acyl-CoA synthetase
MTLFCPQSLIGVYGLQGQDLFMCIQAIWKSQAIYYPIHQLTLDVSATLSAFICSIGVDIDPFYQSWTRALLSDQIMILYNPTEPNMIKSCCPIAYRITTSGTTRQNGLGIHVDVPFQSYVHNLSSIHSILFKNMLTRNMILLSELTFDPHLIEIGLAWITDSPLTFISKSDRSIPDKLFHAIITNEIDLLMMTPSLFLRFSLKQQCMILQGKTMVTDIVLGGEPFPMQLLKYNVPSVQLWNIYGTTECSVWSTLEKIPWNASVVYLGLPLGDTSLKVDEDGQLWMGGPRRRTFIGNEVDPPDFRPTGDYVQQDEQGRLIFLGRKDDQLKRNGCRIHLSQISNLISACPKVLAVE